MDKQVTFLLHYYKYTMAIFSPQKEDYHAYIYLINDYSTTILLPYTLNPSRTPLEEQASYTHANFPSALIKLYSYCKKAVYYG